MLIRAAEPADSLGVARVHVRAWQVGYRSLLPSEYLAGLNVQERASRYSFGDSDPAKPKTLVASVGREIRGFATTLPAVDDDVRGFGEVNALYVDPDHWGRGIGLTLLLAARSALRKAGFNHAVLWVLTGNERAEKFYRADGWKPEGLTRNGARGGVSLNESRHRRALL
jgi:GNAT superfamily N-acetyltransferase